MDYTRTWEELLFKCDIDMDARLLTRSLLAFGVGFSFAWLLIAGPQWDNVELGSVLVILTFFNAFPFLTLTWLANKRGRAVDEALPDFLTMVAANIKSGLTLDRALVLSSRKEFGPLAKEVERAMRRNVGGTGFASVLEDMSPRIKSDLFKKTVHLLSEGVRSGGEIGALLEKTSADLRRFAVVRNETEATVSMYVIFILLAVALGAPFLFALANQLTASMEAMRPDTNSMTFGMASSSQKIDLGLLHWFSLSAITLNSFFGSMAIGVIKWGKRMEGLKYFLPMLIIGMIIFHGAQFILSSMLPVIG